MSNITINVCTSGGGVPRRAPAGGRKWKAKRFRKKMPHLEESGPQDGTCKYSSHRTGQAGRGQAPPRANGASGKRRSRSARFPGSPAGAPRCGPTSTHSLPALAATANNKGGHERPKGPANTRSSTLGPRASAASSHGTAAAPTSAGIPAKCLALDCEMVGAGPKGSISQLARCSIVSYEGDVVYDKFIKPPVPVTDYRTRWSGVRCSDLFNATPYSEARREILRLLMGKVVIGHAVHNDFKVLCYSHPSALTRDTSRIPLLNLKAGFAIDERASLKRLTKAIFNRDIQTGRKGHSSVEDARATMELYRVVEEEWERQLAFKSLAT